MCIRDSCFGALGTDTACSVRMPASWCGVVGLKPTYGLVPLEGILPDAPLFAHCGPLTRTAEDTAFLLNVIAGYESRDITSTNHPKEDYVAQLSQPVADFRIGVARAPFFDHLDPDVAAAIDEAVRVISGLAKGIQDVSLPTYKDLNVDSDGMMEAEGWVFAEHLFDRYSAEFMMGTRKAFEAQQKALNAPSGGCGDQLADYIRGRNHVELIRRTVDEGFDGFDLAILPTMRRTPRTLEDVKKYAENPEETNPENEDSVSYTHLDVYKRQGYQTFSQILDAFHPKKNRAVSDYDVRHLLTADWVYEVPFGQGRQFLSGANSWIQAVVGGWQLTGLGRYTTGLPFGAQIGAGWVTSWDYQSFIVKKGPVPMHRHIIPGEGPEAFAGITAADNPLADCIETTSSCPVRYPVPGETGTRCV